MFRHTQALFGAGRDFGDNAGGPASGPASGPGPGPSPGGPGPGMSVTRSNDRNEWMLGLGLRFFGDGVSGSVEWTTTQGRDHFDDDTVMGTLSFAL